jgi:hypothetical protein
VSAEFIGAHLAGNSVRGGLVVADMVLTSKTGGNADEVLLRALA